MALDQRTKEWHKFRANRISATKFSAALGGKGLKAAMILCMNIGDPEKAESTFTQFRGNAATEWGNMLEADGIEAYARMTGRHVYNRNTHTGYLKEYPMISGSPDAYVDEDGLIELKCVYTGPIPAADHKSYVIQCHAQMLVTGRKWVDLCYIRPVNAKEGIPRDKLEMPQLNASAAAVVYRVVRDDTLLEAMLNCCLAFHAYASEFPDDAIPLHDKTASAMASLKLLSGPPWVKPVITMVGAGAFDPESLTADAAVIASRRPNLVSRMDDVD